MPTDYDGVNVRTLTDAERFIRTEKKEIPLVIEPKSAADLPFLHTFLNSHSELILKDIARGGAVLLRGFAVQTDVDFEKTVLSIRGMRGMHDSFMSEIGRTLVEGTEYVLHTNSIYKTGGTLYLGSFHAENYFSPDVPRYISFCCHKPPKLGGETGLIYMPGVYDELDAALKKKLEARAFRVASWPVAMIAERYSISEEKLSGFFAEAGLTVTAPHGKRIVHLYKPSVFENSQTKQATLVLNLGLPIPGLDQALEKQFEADYSGPRWSRWRMARRFPLLMDLSTSYNPLKTLKEVLARKRKSSKTPAKPPLPDQVGSAFTPTDVECLAQAMRKNFTSFGWKPGDVLLLDNLQIAHAGMPGEGARLVRALVCNPIPLTYLPDTPGRRSYSDTEEGYTSLFDRVTHLS